MFSKRSIFSLHIEKEKLICSQTKNYEIFEDAKIHKGITHPEEDSPPWHPKCKFRMGNQ